MNRLLKSAVLGLAVAATTLSALPSAEAGDRWRRHGGYRHHGHHYNHYGNNGDLVAAGVLGLAVGALVAGVATAPQRDYYEPVYRDVPPTRAYRRAYIQDQRVDYAEGGALEPWSPEWYDYCQSRYRSFNTRTGTYTGYDGVRRFCQAN